MEKRQIKFRGFYNGEMRYPVTSHEYRDSDFWSNEIFEGVPIADISIMQFTGLHDKNGKEVYEGDILFWDHLGMNHAVIVYFNTKEFVYIGKPLKKGKDKTESWLDNKCRVIGNIHEHKHLLNEK